MGRLGPLTAQALGRSPYDEVFMGDGDQDPSPQRFDLRGRPVNDQTRRIHRDMIRAHNEVMQVIGVAEPENTNAALEAELQREHHEYEDDIGGILLRVGRALEIAGVWGINGIRQRILLYKQYSDIPFFHLYRYERSKRTVSQLLLTGLPTYLAGHGLKFLTYNYYPYAILRKNIWLNGAFMYVRVHMQLFVTLQRLDLIPANQWLPFPSFFVPFSSTSPIAAPAPPADFSPRSLLQWLGGAIINAVPMVAFVVWGRLWTRITTRLWQELYGRLPNTVHRRRELPTPPPQRMSAPTAEPEPIISAQDIDPENIPEILRQIEDTVNILAAEAAAESASSTTPPLPPPLAPTLESSTDTSPDPGGPSTPPNPHQQPPVRRQSAFSTRGDDYGSDEEEGHETVNATLISFDVEATESADAPPGLWSAELRPSLGPEAAARAQAPVLPLYMDTMLTRLPACLAADMFSVIMAYVSVAPYEAMALRLVARVFRRRAGLPFDDLQEVNIFADMSWRGVTNFLALEFTHLIVAAEIWAAITGASHLLHIPEEDWKRIDAQERRNGVVRE